MRRDPQTAQDFDQLIVQIGEALGPAFGSRCGDCSEGGLSHRGEGLKASRSVARGDCAGAKLFRPSRAGRATRRASVAGATWRMRLGELSRVVEDVSRRAVYQEYPTEVRKGATGVGVWETLCHLRHSFPRWWLHEMASESDGSRSLNKCCVGSERKTSHQRERRFRIQFLAPPEAPTVTKTTHAVNEVAELPKDARDALRGRLNSCRVTHGEILPRAVGGLAGARERASVSKKGCWCLDKQPCNAALM